MAVMAAQRFFQIHYCFSKERQTFIQPDRAMSDADAWYYACLHARIGVLHNVSHGRPEVVALVRHAHRFGLSEVYWEELP
jgi:hypothetical protein